MNKIKNLIEFIILKILMIVITILPMNLISTFGGFVFKVFGPLTKSHNIARSNYKNIISSANNDEIRENINKSWENIGRTVFELLILRKILKKNDKVLIKNQHLIKDFINSDNSAIFFGIHQSNWEIFMPTLDKLGIKVGGIYRHINNSLIDRLILNKRNDSLVSKESFYTPKGKKSAKDIISGVNENKSIMLLIDQKDSAGDLIKFFNKEVSTQTGFLKIARKYKMPLLPVENERDENNNFIITFHKPIYIENFTDDKEAMLAIHHIVENWIQKNPSQWLWQHNRFN